MRLQATVCNQSQIIPLVEIPTHDQQPTACVAVDLELQPREQQTTERADRDVVLIVDVSGSMSEAIEMVKTTVLNAILLLQDNAGQNANDRVAIVTFGSGATVVLDLTPVAQISSPAAHVRKICIEGSTNLVAGLREAVGVCSRSPPASNSCSTVFVLLTDGCPTDEIVEPDQIVLFLREQVATLASANNLTLSCLGFTANHHSALLVQLSGCLYSQGSYFALTTQADIPMGVASAFAQEPPTRVKLTCKMTGALGWSCHVLGGFKSTQDSENEIDQPANQNTKTVMLTHLREQQPFTIVFLGKFSDDETDPSSTQTSAELLTVSVTMEGEDLPTVTQTAVVTSAEDTIPPHTRAHILRLSGAFVLERIADPAATSAIIETCEHIVNEIFRGLEIVRDCDYDMAIKDELMLQSLEKDVGEVFQKLCSEQRGPENVGWTTVDQLFDSELGAAHVRPCSLTHTDRMHALQAAEVHRFMRSANTATSFSNAYHCKRDRLAQSRMLKKTQQPAQRQAAPLPEVGERTRRIAEDNYKCFVLQTTFEETDMGLGLLVLPRTTRERKNGLLPTCELANDYVSADAFNEGVRMEINRGSTLLNRDDAQVGEYTDENNFSAQPTQHRAVTSSIRGCINAWLPLYINGEHWARASHLAPASFSLIATQFNDLFCAEHALRVCARLLCAVVVRFTVHDGRASERALQMYCDVHRLFLQMAQEHPSIVKEANRVLDGFCNDPAQRSRKHVADLGDMLQYLTITEKFTWEDVKLPFFLEMIRRQGIRMERPRPLQIQTADDFLAFWFEQNPTFGSVTLFCRNFIKSIAHPDGCSLKQVIERYDTSWGVCDAILLGNLKRSVEAVSNASIVDTVNELLDGGDPTYQATAGPLEKEDVANLFLWVMENKDCDNTHKAVDFSTLDTRRGLWNSWVENARLHAHANEQNRAPELTEQRAKRRLVAPQPELAISGVVQQLRESAGGFAPTAEQCSQAVNAHCDCRECQKQRLKLEQRKQHSNNLCKLVVSGLARDHTADEIQQDLQRNHTHITNVFVPVHMRTKKLRGYAVVEFASQEFAADAMNIWNVHRQVPNTKLKDIVVDLVRAEIDPAFETNKPNPKEQVAVPTVLKACNRCKRDKRCNEGSFQHWATVFDTNKIGVFSQLVDHVQTLMSGVQTNRPMPVCESHVLQTLLPKLSLCRLPNAKLCLKLSEQCPVTTWQTPLFTDVKWWVVVTGWVWVQWKRSHSNNNVSGCMSCDAGSGLHRETQQSDDDDDDEEGHWLVRFGRWGQDAYLLGF